MNQGTACLSKKSLLSPLAVPDSDNINVDSGLGTQTSGHLFTDCLLSPVHPSVWKSASPHARFGIDIGGTLCKVVFFEPLDSLDSMSLLNSNFQPLTMDALLGKDASHVEKHDVNNHGSTTVSEECFCSSKLLEFSQDPQDPRKVVSIKPPSLVSGIRFEKREGCIYNVDSDNMDPNVSGVNRTVLRSDGIIHSISDSNKEFAKYCKTGSKLWVSSHDPVILHGRGALFFKCFETWRMEEFLFLTREHSLVTGQRALGATGGGARKFRSQFLEIADLQLSHFDELKCLVQGIDFLMNYAPHESFEYPKGSFQGGLIQRPLRSPEDNSNDSDQYLSEGAKSNSVHQQAPAHPQSCEETLSKAKMSGPVLCNTLCQREGRPEARKLYPYLVVNIGSGVSILLVESREQFKRVGGTSLGGSTFLGLVSALTGCTSFKEAIELAAEGDSTEIDMLVGDIYGGDYSEMGLAATTVASSFGKLVLPSRRDAAAKTPQHLAKATLLMITNNIGSLAKLHAQSTGVEHVLFTGSFMHGNKLAMRLLTVAMEFWSKGQIKAMFLRHGGHAGAMGALLHALDPCNQMDALLLS